VTEQQGRELQQQINALDYFEITTYEVEVLDLLATEVVRVAVGKPKPNRGKKKKKEKGSKLSSKHLHEKKEGKEKGSKSLPCLLS
jgi:hypothetical protein